MMLKSVYRGLSLASIIGRVVGSIAVMWTTAEKRGFGDEFLQGLASVPSLVWNGLHLLRRPGGDG